jgi:putative N6-adenine-specific DNA methylase
VDKDDPDLRVHLHLHRDRATLALDSSGESLHKRGWRKHQGRAPLAETLAAAIVELSGWDRRSPLVDPFCGGGTILIEAALRAENVAPGLFRERFGFERWRGHDADAFAKLRETVRAQVTPVPKLVLLGSDIDDARLREARENAEPAGLAGRIAFERKDAADFVPKRGWNAWIVTNPPYGERVGEERALAKLHAGFGARLREHAAGWTLALLTGNPRLAAALDLPSARRIALMNGAIGCELLVASL